MALTLEAEQRLRDVGLIDFFESSQDTWSTMAKDTYDFVKNSFPSGEQIRIDDVAQVFIPILAVDEDLKDYLNIGKLKQKYWISDFCDLILDRNWDSITA